jgi:hypothetical protein
MSPGGGVSVPAGTAPAGDGAAVAGAAALDDVACGGGVLPEPLLQALAQSPAAARTTSRLVIVLALTMAECYESADQRRRCAR